MRKLFVIILIGALFLMALLLFFASFKVPSYEHSALGNKGLEVLLNKNGLKAKTSDKYKQYQLQEFDFAILSIDNIIFNYLNNDGLLSYVNNIQRLQTLLRQKVSYLPTIVVLPKWRQVVNKELKANEKLVLLQMVSTDIMEILDYENVTIERMNAQFTRENVELSNVGVREIELYNAQYFVRDSIPDECNEVFGIKAGALMLDCFGDYEAYFVSDPDLLNNHGLSLNKNSVFAYELIQKIISDYNEYVGNDSSEYKQMAIYLDSNEKLFPTKTPARNHESKKNTPSYQRTSEDFARLFEYPLSMIWAAMLMIIIVCLWRGAFRFGPPLKHDKDTLELSKTAAIGSMARLLRLSGNDGSMVAHFVQNSLLARAIAAYGASGGNEAGVARLIQRIGQNDALLAKKITEVSQSLIKLGPMMKRHELHKNLAEFRDLLRRVDLESR